MVPKAFELHKLWTAKSHATILSVFRGLLLKCEDENLNNNCMEYSVKGMIREHLLKSIQSLAPFSVIQIIEYLCPSEIS